VTNSVVIVTLDLSERSSAKRVIEHALSSFGRIDALINIAGAGPLRSSLLQRHFRIAGLPMASR
jgi:NAD(P)-dependent dehydrogenase (short-subunit alcohol dehydrogenase family)